MVSADCLVRSLVYSAKNVRCFDPVHVLRLFLALFKVCQQNGSISGTSPFCLGRCHIVS